MPEHTEPTRRRLRKLNLVMLVPPLAAGGAAVVVVDSRTWWDAVILASGVVAALVAFERWTARDLSRFAPFCLIVTAAVWPLGVLVIDSPGASYGLTLVGSLVVPYLKRYRAAAAVGLVGYVAAVGATRLLVSSDDVSDVLLQYVVLPAGAVAVITGLMFPNKRFYDVVEELQESRKREAELAVFRERVRFASDLHDIQGHTLHVVKLKIALARKLVRTDPDRVDSELREIYSLVSDTIKQTKELAYAQRRLNLSAELENAKNLFEAAGIRVRVDREAEVDTRADELLGQVLRETTTNILRHAQATQVKITLSGSGITVVNDGAPQTPLPELHGLATLRDRVADSAGELTVEQTDGRFLTAATFPRPGTAPMEDR
ncbi:two-component system sensor histidine kinase DesK [Micromonospora sp. Llam0]|uniref:sensor histidine kinase n=1 Tax=Micromonospora sp. Llam0 TaxID=2485143 RepID=UPI000F4709C7|nr:histidine kinase [Micromonospora sp. Llam0]ROO63302.1 two-component system sensor histidine kinase DesK [Micromonospora sp. Llam0]